MLNKRTVNEVFRLALPIVGENFIYMIIMVFDTMMIGNYGGKNSVSAVGMCSELIFAFNSIFIDVGISIAITSLVARKVGAKQYKAAEEYASIGFAVGAIISAVLTFILFNYTYRLLRIAGAKDNVVFIGVHFMRYAAFGAFFKMLTSLLSSILRGHGNTWTPLKTAIIINIVNLGLDWILIYGKLGSPSLGVKGGALALFASQLLGFIYILYFIVTKSLIKIKLGYIFFFSIFRLKELLKLSIPTSLEEAAFSLSRLVSLSIILHNGTVAFASNQIATTIESISYMPGLGFGVAATALVGIKVGEKNYVKAQEYAYTCAALAGIIMVFCAGLFLIAPNFLIGLFVSDAEKEVVYWGALCLMVASVEQPFMSLSMVFAGALKGIGDTKSPFVISLLTCWLIRVPLIYYFIHLLKYPVVYVWWITTIQWCADGLIMFLAFEKKFKRPFTTIHFYRNF